MSYRCVWISHRAYIKRISILIGCISVPCRFIYVAYKSYIDFMSIMYRFYIGVISMYIDCTPSAFKSYIDSYMLYTSTNAQVKRFGQGQAKSTHRLAQRLSCPVFWAAARRARAQIWLTWSLAPAGAPGQSQVNASLVFRHYVVVWETDLGVRDKDPHTA